MAEATRVPTWSRSSAAGLLLVLISGCTTGVEMTAPQDRLDPSTRSDSNDPVGGQPIDLPASRIGDLGQEDLPQPTDLGRGWGYRIDHGNAEDGYLGSGEPAIARDPASVLAAITPLGCRPGDLPWPQAALEVTYAKRDLPAVGMVLQFADDAQATEFFVQHSEVLAQCIDAEGVKLSIQRRTNKLLVSTRVEQLGETPAWTEGVGLRGDEVMLIAVADASPGGIRSVTSALS